MIYTLRVQGEKDLWQVEASDMKEAKEKLITKRGLTVAPWSIEGMIPESKESEPEAFEVKNVGPF